MSKKKISYDKTLPSANTSAVKLTVEIIMRGTRDVHVWGQRGGIGFVCLVGFLTSSSTTRLYRGRAPRQERLTILRAATHETELGDHDFCLSRSHYTDTDPTCRQQGKQVKAFHQKTLSQPYVNKASSSLLPQR